jgi:integrase/recombinase XerD
VPEQQYQGLTVDKTSVERKIDNATEGLPKQVSRKLRSVKNDENIFEIANYVMAMKTEANISDNYRACVIKTLCLLSAFHNHTNFKRLTRDDLLAYLDSRRKSESDDQQHKWIGTYNLYRAFLLRFFKWLSHPELRPDERPKPPCTENIPQLKRKEVSVYKPSDLWTAEDDILFLKYCPSKRDRCYHTISKDTSCRPHEILKLRMRDVVFKMAGNKQYAEVILSGKTGQRHVPVIDSLPYLKDWMDSHPFPGNPNFPLICGSSRSLGRRMNSNSINRIYHDYEKRFRGLVRDPNVPQADKVAIAELLKKPWNPYIRRHSALTEKAKILKEPILKIHAGWSQQSNMHLKYEHWFGNESSESILEAYGLKTKAENIDKMKPKQCPNCSETNKIDSKFCSKCRMVLSYDAYTETVEEKQQKESEVKSLNERYEKDMKEMRQEMENKFNQILAKIDMKKLGL